MINLFGAQFCPLDLVKDDVTGKLSSTKIWMHAANVIMSMVVLKQVNIGWELLLAYGAVVGGSHIAIYWLKAKYAPQASDAAKE